MIILKNTENIFSKEASLTDIFLKLLPETTAYSDFIRKTVDNILLTGEKSNE